MIFQKLKEQLNSKQVEPNKKLGQCFLVSKKALEKITALGEIKKGEKILEIGPGTGVLTQKMIESGGQVLAVEKDRRLFEILQQKFKKEIREGNLKLILSDFLNLKFPDFLLENNFSEKKYKVIANLPYQITSPVFKRLFENNFLPETIVLTMQKEVAERICADCGELGSLGVLVQSMSQNCRIELKLNPACFCPQPKVDSAVLKISGIDYPKKIEIAFFRKILRSGFGSKRKKLKKNLKNIFPKEKIDLVWEKLEIEENLRAEDLPVEGWQRLARELDK